MSDYQEIEDQALAAGDLQESAAVLERLLCGPYAVWDDGHLYNIKALVDRVRGLRIEVHPKEHPPPHFHVHGAGVDAALSIADCRLLAGELNGRDLRIVEWWFKRSKALLASRWDETRPGDGRRGASGGQGMTP